MLFEESFDDTDFASRGWYDAPSGTLSSDAVAGSSFQCDFATGATGCTAGTPGRHPLTESESVYLGVWIKYSDNWVGSQRSYHPHEFHFVTTYDSQWVGPAFTHLTLYIEHVGGTARLALQDSENVDLSCVLLNNDSFVGCDGDFDTYSFTEARSVASCNGLVGYVDGRDCFSYGGGYYSARFWDSPDVVFSDDAGDHYKADWHFVEAYFEMNSVVDGVGIADGKIRYVFDGETLISSDEILYRTGQHPDMAWNQFLISSYIGDGSPIDQTLWYDELVVGTGRPAR